MIAGLDAIMHNQYTRQPVKLRAWKCANLLERAPQWEKKPTTTPPAPGHPPGVMNAELSPTAAVEKPMGAGLLVRAD